MKFTKEGLYETYTELGYTDSIDSTEFALFCIKLTNYMNMLY